MASQTGRPGASQQRHPRGAAYPTPELIPQGTLLSVSPRGAPLLIAFTNPQRPLFGTGLRSPTLPPPIFALFPPQGPIARGY